MKAFKKFMALFIATICVLTAIPISNNDTVITVQAHSGRTDANGGHKDNKNVSGLGSYHYHCGGYPAHLHENGVCPYANGVAVTDAAKTESKTAADTQKSTNTTDANKKDTASVAKTTKQTVTISDTSYDNVAFNATYYANAHADVYETCGNDAKALYNHFIKTGIKEGRQSSAQFWITAYKDNNQDLVDIFGDDLIKYYNHYIECGVNEGRVSK